MEQTSTKPKRRPYTRRKKDIQQELPKWITSPSDQCINDVLPMNDLINNIIHYLSVSDIAKLSIICKLYQELIPDSIFKKYINLDDKNKTILEYYFTSINQDIPFKQIAISFHTGCCVICFKSQYCYRFDHLPKFYVCRSCCGKTGWLKNVCKRTVESTYFLTRTQQTKHNISLSSFYVRNPHFKSAPAMELFWEIEVKYYTEKIFGGSQGFLEETTKREKKKLVMAEKRDQQNLRENKSPKAPKSFKRFKHNNNDENFW